MCTGKIFFARPYAINPPSPNHQPSPHHKSWRAPNVTTRRMCRGEIYFAPTCAVDAQSPTRCDRVAATRRRTTDVRAKNISPVLAPMMRNRPHIVVARPPNSPPHHGCTGEIFFARARAVDAPSPTRFDRVAATHRRTMDVGAEYFSPVRARLTRHRSHIGRQRATLHANDCVICRHAICGWRGRA